jgi:hypothetical protein
LLSVAGVERYGSGGHWMPIHAVVRVDREGVPRSRGCDDFYQLRRSAVACDCM